MFSLCSLGKQQQVCVIYEMLLLHCASPFTNAPRVNTNKQGSYVNFSVSPCLFPFLSSLQFIYSLFVNLETLIIFIMLFYLTRRTLIHLISLAIVRLRCVKIIINNVHLFIFSSIYEFIFFNKDLSCHQTVRQA